MSRRSSSPPAYKGVTFQQFRSFCETVRLGSFSAAAAALDLSHPTIWNQVRELERHFGVRLVEAHARGCRVTEAGQLLIELAAPLVTGFSSLEGRFQEALTRKAHHLVVACPARILIEDLPECVVQFGRQRPEVHLTLKELPAEEVTHSVISKQSDLGLTTSSNPRPGDAWLHFVPCYELDVVLVTPKNHPLARRRVLRPSDLRAYPLVNAPSSFVDVTVRVALEKLGILNERPRLVEASDAGTIRRCVALGFGIGLVGSVRPPLPQSELHERSMSDYFGRLTVYLVSRAGNLQSPYVQEFADIIQSQLSRKESPTG